GRRTPTPRRCRAPRRCGPAARSRPPACRSAGRCRSRSRVSCQLRGVHRAAPYALHPHRQPLLGVRAAEQRVTFQPVAGAEGALLGRQEGQDGGQGPDAEVLPVGDLQVGAVLQLEVVADGHAADRAALDRVDGDPQVVDLHVVVARGHAPSLSSSAWWWAISQRPSVCRSTSVTRECWTGPLRGSATRTYRATPTSPQTSIRLSRAVSVSRTGRWPAASRASR